MAKVNPTNKDLTRKLRSFLFGSLAFSLFSHGASAQIPNEVFNALNLDSKLSWEQYEGTKGRSFSARLEGAHVNIRVTNFSSAELALKAAEIETLNLTQLYAKRGNPYRGQLSQALVCAKNFKPKQHDIIVLDTQVKGIFGAVGSRKDFGACNKDTAKSWGLFFAFARSGGLNLTSVRIIDETSKISDSQKSERKLLALAKKIFDKDGS